MKRKSSEWEEIIAKEATDKGLISKIIQRVHAAQYYNNKQTNQKMGRRPKQILLQRRHKDGQQTHGKNVQHFL